MRKAQQGFKREIVSVDPFRCRMWEFHDRLESYVTEETCRSEIDSIARHGQLVPALGRLLQGDPEHDVELVYGARRLFVARHTNTLLLVELRKLSDQEALIAMDIENRQRADISPYERGLSYARWLRAGHFQSQEEIARALKISNSQVSRLLKLARLPSVILDAFRSPLDICEGWGLTLMGALEDSTRRDATIRKAREIASGQRPTADDVYDQLLGASTSGRKMKKASHDMIIRDHSGTPLFRVRHLRSAVALILPRDRVSAACLDSVCLAVAKALPPCTGVPLSSPERLGGKLATHIDSVP